MPLSRGNAWDEDMGCIHAGGALVLAIQIVNASLVLSMSKPLESGKLVQETGVDTSKLPAQIRAPAPHRSRAIEVRHHTKLKPADPSRSRSRQWSD